MQGSAKQRLLFADGEPQPGFGWQYPGKTSHRRGTPVLIGMNPVIVGVWQRRVLFQAPRWKAEVPTGVSGTARGL